MPNKAISVRLTPEQFALVENLASSKKINKSKAIQHIINTYATLQNNNPFELIQNQISDLTKLVESNNYRINSNINKAIIASKESKYITLYDFAHRADSNIAKSYLEAAEKRAREN